jgi:protein-tyrosine phosphatase
MRRVAKLALERSGDHVELPSVLVVCTANICRSPAAAALLTDLLGPGVRVHSAGVHALTGAPACVDAAATLNSAGSGAAPGAGSGSGSAPAPSSGSGSGPGSGVGSGAAAGSGSDVRSAGGRRARHRAPAGVHEARKLTADDVRAATLVLTAAREHRAAVAGLVPAAQSYTFTLAQAARIAAWQASRPGAAPAQGDGAARLAWLVRELDAGRGAAPRPQDEADDDIPDPHLDGVSHELAMQQVLDAVRSLAVLISGDPFGALGR